MFPQGCHAFTFAETRVSCDGNLPETYKKRRPKTWRRKTRGNVKYQLTETCDCCHVSATVSLVYVTFPLRVLEIWSYSASEPIINFDISKLLYCIGPRRRPQVRFHCSKKKKKKKNENSAMIVG